MIGTGSIDLDVALFVMGWKRTEHGGVLHAFDNGRIVSTSGTVHTEHGREITFRPSACHDHAFEVVERLRLGLGIAMVLAYDPDNHSTQPWHVAMRKLRGPTRRSDARGPTPQIAICHAALKACTP